MGEREEEEERGEGLCQLLHAQASGWRNVVLGHPAHTKGAETPQLPRNPPPHLSPRTGGTAQPEDTPGIASLFTLHVNRTRTLRGKGELGNLVN